jgi:hypothetical protein
MRLLLCLTCETIEEISDHDGPPESDVLLEELVARHRFGDGSEHMGNLIQVADREYITHRERILSQIREGTTGLSEADPDFYAAKNTFQEEAARCFERHRRPDECIDYKDKSKQLGNPLRRSQYDPAQRRYLCEFCPVEVKVNQRKQKEGIWTP